MEKKTANNTITLAKDQDHLTTLEYTEAIFEDSSRFHGDRYFVDDSAVVGGVVTLQGKPVTMIDVQKDQDLPESTECNFGSPSSRGYRKALRLMEQAEKFNRLVITFVNTVGACCRIDAEEREEGGAIAQSLLEMPDLEVPIISVIIDKGGNGGVLALAVADGVWMLERTIYAAFLPRSFASILWKDGSRAKEIAELMKITATELKELAIVDRVTPEVTNGQSLKQAKISRMLQKAFVSKLIELAKLDTGTLLEKRYQRFHKY